MNIDINGPDAKAVEVAKRVLFNKEALTLSTADVIQLAENVVRFHAVSLQADEWIQAAIARSRQPQS